MGYATTERACRICGCTESRACMTDAGPCHWVEGNLCSAPKCAAHARALTDADIPRLEQLVTDHRLVLLAVHDGKEYDAIARDQDVKLGTIKSRISRARAALAQLRLKDLEAA